ncbi:ATP-dependent DNA helicase [Anaerobacillus isosaccharinicus]|uniref:ATP-dependent DNA helicase n=1 Tax=Anaerobacillus isosaccharinicus TaxID=1532552 RepID=A0A1S2M0H4_9BACI|nr:ATP-dependent DNA helicase [Anaerobacillus isosaccharinicus]MBA5586566.1 ATP-dependent DNA helicase [Anaerobacillus isosaccharinicus]QOY35198.1 ATP-dependent DNA helicase [Anaerobacillus isosaccharinicus]
MGDIRVRVSVRNLVEFVMMSGSIELGAGGAHILEEGTKTHQRLQSNREEGYQKEVTLSQEFERNGFAVTVHGRCDGIISNENEIAIEEIKSTSRPLSTIHEEDHPTYWAQAKVYAYIFAFQNQLEQIDIHLVYASRQNTESVTFQKSFSKQELDHFIEDLLEDYLQFQEILFTQRRNRQTSIPELSFPFPKYRNGQRDLLKAVYKTISEKKRLFAKASTGIGKTISTIFPTVKAVGEKKADRILYVTAKTITRQVAEEAFQLLNANGLVWRTVTITAKEKVCFQEEVNCSKEHCPFANGYYDRLKEGLKNILTHEQMVERTTVEFYAKKHQLCPFEFSLDVALHADAVICDYNYFFDPRVKMQRWSEHHKDTVLLIDEAHNLVDRARGMFSASISKSAFLDASRLLKGKNPELYEKTKAVNASFLQLKKECMEKDQFDFFELPVHVVEVSEEFLEFSDRWLSVPGNYLEDYYSSIKDLFYEVQAFCRVSKVYDDHFRTVVTVNKSEVQVKLLCLDPSRLIRSATKKTKATIFFSATLHPLGYFQTVLGGEEIDYFQDIPSPFDEKKVDVLVSPISTKYKDRQDSIEKIITVLREELHGRRGNFLVFFPSYEYLSQVLEHYEEIAIRDDIELLVQAQMMSEEEREMFLEKFQPNATGVRIGFAVLGGIFAEGVDLRGDRLNGVCIIGVGLPKITEEQDIIKQHYSAQGYNGFDFAYVYPGMNKVHQAGGRLIRSEEDEGVIFLIDDRYLSAKYRNLLPSEWRNFKLKG